MSQKDQLIQSEKMEGVEAPQSAPVNSDNKLDVPNQQPETQTVSWDSSQLNAEATRILELNQSQ